MPIDEDQIYAVTGLNKPADYEAQKKKIEEQAAVPPIVPNTPENEPPVPNQKPPKDKKNKKDRKLSLFQEFRLWAADFFAPAPKH